MGEGFKAKKLARSLLRKLSETASSQGNNIVLGTLEVRVRYIEYAKKGFLRKGSSYVVHSFPSVTEGEPVEAVIDVYEGGTLIATFLVSSDGRITFSGEGIMGETEAILLLGKLDEELASISRHR